jgi:hypothetical protein
MCLIQVKELAVFGWSALLNTPFGLGFSYKTPLPVTRTKAKVF